MSQTDPIRVRIGCPVFGARSWVGSVLPPGTSAQDQLRAYAEILDTVEGNGTFYGLPSADAVLRWAESTTDRFRFALKVPRSISHERALHGFESDLAALETLFDPIRERLGPFMLQLPPAADRRVFPRLARFLARASKRFRWSVELRHPDWFDEARHERDLHRLLVDEGAERVCLDSRSLFAVPPADAATLAAQGKKPRVPPRFVGLGAEPVVRIIGRNEPEGCDPVLNEWASVVSRWMDEGRTPLVFCHTPDEHFAPALCRRFHMWLRKYRPDLTELPAWPLPKGDSARQLSLI